MSPKERNIMPVECCRILHFTGAQQKLAIGLVSVILSYIYLLPEWSHVF